MKYIDMLLYLLAAINIIVALVARIRDDEATELKGKINAILFTLIAHL